MKKVSVLIVFLLATVFSSLVPASISAAWTKYSGNPILEPGPSGTWDDQGVFGPSIMFRDGIYKMWYSGYGGPAATSPVGRMGYATSSDGLHWDKNALPVLSPSDPWEIHLGQPHVIFDADERIYKMWFTSTGIGENKWRIGYATSDNGVVWDRFTGYVLTEGIPGTWDSSGVVAPSVLKTDNQYHMWFASYISSQWQIGYAASGNGTAWEKHPGNPILLPSPSEFPAIGDPHVIQTNSYTMFYHANHPPSTVNMADSTDGINWTRSPDNPLLQIGGSGSFDDFQIAGVYVMKSGNIYHMWYSAKGTGSSYWRIGYASTEEVAPTATPVPTATPTLVSTPTPTPTVAPKKVVFAPGLGGSWNADAILNCKTEGYAGNWILAPFAAGTYTPLLSALAENGEPFYYDWRKDVRSQAPVLQNFINNLTGGSESEKVNFVGHSLGGLVGRAYLENKGADSRLEKLLTVGSPHQGAPQAYPAWSGGEIWENNLATRIATTILLRRCAARREEPREVLRRVVPSVQNLLPIFNYLRNNKTKQLKPAAQMNAKNNWLPTGFPFYDVSVGTLSGNGFPTLSIIKVKERDRRDVRSGNWADGKPVGKETVNEGDGTALLLSTQLIGADNRVINQNHGGLVSSTEGIAQILDFLGTESAGTTALETVIHEPKAALIVIGYPSSFWVMDAEGKLIKDKDGLVSIANPGKNNYKFGLIPKSDKTLFIVAQFLEDGRVLWKEYNLKNRLPKFGKINFDPGNPQEDALQ